MLLTDLSLLSEVLARTPHLESPTENRLSNTSEGSGAPPNSEPLTTRIERALSVADEDIRSIVATAPLYANPLDANDVSDSDQYQGCSLMCRNATAPVESKRCGLRGPGEVGYLCTLEEGHEGQHEAYGNFSNSGEPYEIWPQDPPNKEELVGYSAPAGGWGDPAAYFPNRVRANVFIGGKQYGQDYGPNAPRIMVPVIQPPKAEPAPVGLPTDDKVRKEDYPLYSFMFGYFPDSWLAVVRVAVEGNKQHNPGQPLHWAREKSKDQMNTAWRHQFDYGRGVKKDTDGQWHLAKAIWRLSAQLQLDIEEERRQNGDQ